MHTSNMLRTRWTNEAENGDREGYPAGGDIYRTYARANNR